MNMEPDGMDQTERRFRFHIYQPTISSASNVALFQVQLNPSAQTLPLVPCRTCRTCVCVRRKVSEQACAMLRDGILSSSSSERRCCLVREARGGGKPRCDREWVPGDREVPARPGRGSV